MIELDCPGCGHHLRIDDRYAGTQGRCKHCGGTVSVPTLQSAGPPPLEEFRSSQAVAVGSGSGTDIRRVGQRQKMLLVAVLLGFLVNIAIFSTASIPEVNALAWLLSLLLIPFTLYCVWSLGKALGKSNGILVVFAVLCLFPVIALVVLLIVNGEATKVLRKQGIKVGIFGAKLGELPATESPKGGINKNTPQAPAQESELNYAGFWRRFGAAFIDALVLSSPLVYVAWLLSPTVLSICLTIFDRIIPEVQPYLVLATLAGAGVLTVLFVTLPYFVLMEYSPLRGTLGKVLFGVVVATPSGEPISLQRSFGRYFAKYLSTAPVWIGFLVAAFNRRKRGFHDIVAGTVTITSGSGFVTPMTARVVALPIALASLFAVGTVPDGMEERYLEVFQDAYLEDLQQPRGESARSAAQSQPSNGTMSSSPETVSGRALPPREPEVSRWLDLINRVPDPDLDSIAMGMMGSAPANEAEAQLRRQEVIADYLDERYAQTLESLGYSLDATLYESINLHAAIETGDTSSVSNTYLQAYRTDFESPQKLTVIAINLYPMRSLLHQAGLISDQTLQAFEVAGQQSEALRWMGGDPTTAGARTQSIRDSIRGEMDASRNRAGSARPGYQGSYGYNQQ